MQNTCFFAFGAVLRTFHVVSASSTDERFARIRGTNDGPN